MKKKIFLSVFYFFGIHAIAQNLDNIPCIEINPSPGLTSAHNCLTIPSLNTTSSITGGIQSLVISGDEIFIGPGFSANNFTTGWFNARIEQPQVEFGVVEPINLNDGIGQYEKLEIGIKIPEPLKTYVENYISGQGSPQVNPFDPDQINVYADFQSYHATNSFFHPYWGLFENRKIYGFYYEEFERDLASNHIENWHHDLVANDYKFRGRFAPPATGSWRGMIKIETPYGNFTSDWFYFNCKPSTNPGYMTVGTTSKRYFRRGNDFFYPVGQNLFDPHSLDKYYANEGRINVPYIRPQHAHPWKMKNFIEEDMVDFKNAGGNYFRYLLSTWNGEIEFEKLNNYYDRLNSAWEFDNVVEQAKNLNLLIHFDLQYTTPFWNRTYGMVLSDWEANGLDELTPADNCYEPTDVGYCYHSQLGVTTPMEFLTDPVAKKHYKNRLRYIISRWGYSTNIGVMELMNEINTMGQLEPNDPNTADYEPCMRISPQGYYPYEDLMNQTNVGIWQNEMATYIKNTLGHNEHLIAVNYASNFAEVNSSNSDNSYYYYNIDLPTNNYYTDKVTRFDDAVTNVTDFSVDINSSKYTGKPMFFSETGAVDCDGGVQIIKSIWIAPFTGVAGALEWSNQGNERGIWEGDHYHHFKNFIDGLDFDFGDWKPQTDVRGNDSLAAVFALVDESSHKAIGIIENRTYNSYNFAQFGDCLDVSTMNWNGCQNCNSLQDVSAATQVNGNDRLEITVGGSIHQYHVEWINLINYSVISNEDKWSDLLGHLELEYPDLIVTDQDPAVFSPLIGFRIHRFGDSFRSSPTSQNVIQENVVDDIDKEKNSINLFNMLSVSPNPNHGIFNLFIQSSSNSNPNLYILDISGRILHTQSVSIQEGTIQIQIFKPELPAGVYFIKVDGFDEPIKMIITK